MGIINGNNSVGSGSSLCGINALCWWLAAVKDLYLWLGQSTAAIHHSGHNLIKPVNTTNVLSTKTKTNCCFNKSTNTFTIAATGTLVYSCFV